MNLIIAMSNIDFAKELKIGLLKHGVKVLEIVTTEEDLLEELVRHKDTVNGVLLKSDLALKMGQSRLEVLVDVIEAIRKEPRFKELVFTLLADEKAGHPFLAEVVDLGIYNIFVKGQTSFSITTVLDTFEVPRNFANVAAYKNVDSSIPWRKDLQKNSAINIQFSEQQQEATQETKGNFLGKFFKKGNNGKPQETEDDVPVLVESPEENLDSSIELEESHKEESTIQTVESSIESNSIEAKKSSESMIKSWMGERNKSEPIKPTVVGTVIIGVAGVNSSSGCTNTAINIAKFLTNQKYKVALVEANRSMDFDRIHSLHEGERIQLQDVKFELQGVQHFKYRDDLNINEIFTNYEYVVIDFGFLEASPLKHEFYRSHIKLLTCSADEWKYYLIEHVILETGLEDLIFVVPAATNKWVKDLESRLKIFKAYSIGATDSPYLVSTESETSYATILRGYMKVPKRISYGALALTGIISIILTATVFVLFT